MAGIAVIILPMVTAFLWLLTWGVRKGDEANAANAQLGNEVLLRKKTETERDDARQLHITIRAECDQALASLAKVQAALDALRTEGAAKLKEKVDETVDEDPAAAANSVFGRQL